MISIFNYLTYRRAKQRTLYLTTDQLFGTTRGAMFVSCCSKKQNIGIRARLTTSVKSCSWSRRISESASSKSWIPGFPIPKFDAIVPITLAQDWALEPRWGVPRKTIPTVDSTIPWWNSGWSLAVMMACTLLVPEYSNFNGSNYLCRRLEVNMWRGVFSSLRIVCGAPFQHKKMKYSSKAIGTNLLNDNATKAVCNEGQRSMTVMLQWVSQSLAVEDAWARFTAREADMQYRSWSAIREHLCSILSVPSQSDS